MPLPFTVDLGEWLEGEPRAVFEEGAVFAATAGEHDPRVVPLLAVAWLHEPAGVTLEAVVEEDIVRLLSDPGDLLLDREDVRVDGVKAVRTFCVHVGPSGVATASEQWRLLSGGRRWTVGSASAVQALLDGEEPAQDTKLAAALAGARDPVFTVTRSGSTPRRPCAGTTWRACSSATVRPAGGRCSHWLPSRSPWHSWRSSDSARGHGRTSRRSGSRPARWPP
jgi:hypothetical protein